MSWNNANTSFLLIMKQVWVILFFNLWFQCSGLAVVQYIRVDTSKMIENCFKISPSHLFSSLGFKKNWDKFKITQAKKKKEKFSRTSTIYLNCQKCKWRANTKSQSGAFGCSSAVVRKSEVKSEEKPRNCWESGSIKGPSTNIIVCFAWLFASSVLSRDEAGKGPGERRELCQGCVGGQGRRELCSGVALCWLTWGGGQRNSIQYLFGIEIYFLFSVLATVHSFEYLLLVWEWRSSFYLLYTNPCMNYLSLNRN